MSKTLTSANSNVLDDNVIVPVHFLKIEYTSGTLYLNTSDRNIVFDSIQYIKMPIDASGFEFKSKQLPRLIALGRVSRALCTTMT